jgi:hypothetical protein
MALNANALTTLAIAKKWIKIPTTVTDQDDVVEILINGFSQEIEALAQRKLKSQSVTEIKHGRGTNLILFREWPVTAISELRIDGGSLFTDPATVIDPADYTLADDGNSLLLIGGTFPRGYNNVRVTYTAGYTTVPADLQQACLDLCFWKYRTRESGDIGRKQKGKASESEQWHQDWPPGPLAAVMRYKRTEMPGIDAPVQNY